MGEAYLTDTNILLRLVKRDHSDYALVRGALAVLRNRHVSFYYTMQNMSEFWNVATRPRAHNGFGLELLEAEQGAREIENSFTLLPDTASVYWEWRRLISAHGVRGASVHDARLVAVMRAYGLKHLLTFNDSDFRRYSDITVVTPRSLASL
jgi:predicted nucleic acid-binding protein